MGLLGERISGFVEDRIQAWRERLRGWTVAVIGLGLEAFMHAVGKAGARILAPFIDSMEATGEVPEEIKQIFEELKHPTTQWQGMLAMGAGMGVMGTAIGMIGDAMFGAMARRMMSKTKPSIADVGSMITLKRRGYIDDKFFYDYMEQWGYNRVWADHLLSATEAFPALQDVIRFYAREAFEPDMIKRYGLRDELPPYAGTLFEKLGVPKEIADLYWISHWEHATWMQVVEMLRRGQLTEAEVREWFRVVEIPPYWRDKLIAISYEVPTRVDVRRWWDLRTIDEVRLREIYAWQGYHGKDLDDYVLWTKVYTAFPDLIARWKNGWISLDDVRDELTGLGMPAERVDQLIETKIKATAAERTTKERDLTKSDIYKGVKQGRITRAEGMELLMDLRFSEFEADYLLAINIPPDEEDQAVTARQLTKGDISAAVKRQIITPAQATDRLMVLRYGQADAEFLASLYATQIPIEQVEPQRDLTKGDIAKGLKQGILSVDEAYAELLGLRYSPEDADFLITANMPTEAALEEEERRQLSKSDIKSALNTGVITVDQAIERLEELEYSPDDARFLIGLYTELQALKPITQHREASKADIVAGVKKGLLTPEEGYLMLQDIDFSPEAAEFILSVRAEVSPFSPTNLQEFKDLTSMWRRSAGMETKPVPEELKKAAGNLVLVTKEAEDLRAELAEEEAKLVPDMGLAPEVTKRRDEIRVALRRAEASLAKSQADYDRLVAAYKHGAES